jgi:FMN phosphatase YigB (HAD superfamily)
MSAAARRAAAGAERPRAPADVVCFFDVDNTLLDNDRVEEDLSHHLDAAFGPSRRVRYFEIFEELRHELGYADYLGALQRYRVQHPHDPRVLDLSLFLIEYPFAERLYPNALAAVAHAGTEAMPVILSDGDVVFQPWKIRRSGLWEALHGDVLIYIHKERSLDDVERHYPAEHYVLIDDKLRILTAVKRVWGARVTTVFPRQGHYAADPEALKTYPPADVTLTRIGDLVGHAVTDLVAAARPPAGHSAATP